MASPEQDPQLALPWEPEAVVEVEDRFTAALSGREDRDYRSPPQPRSQARALAALLLDSAAGLDGDGPWQRALAGGRRVVRIRDSDDGR